jgi:hypothetical protein
MIPPTGIRRPDMPTDPDLGYLAQFTPMQPPFWNSKEKPDISPAQAEALGIYGSAYRAARECLETFAANETVSALCREYEQAQYFHYLVEKTMHEWQEYYLGFLAEYGHLFDTQNPDNMG